MSRDIGVELSDRQWDRLQHTVVRLSRDGVMHTDEIAADANLDGELVRHVLDYVADLRHSDLERERDGWVLTTPTIVIEGDRSRIES